jgi:hypothetical protein
MNDFSDEDIELFIDSYKKNLLDDIILNSKIPIWVEYLKTKRHFRQNGMDEDYFFKKRFNIVENDNIQIMKLIDRVKRGKKLVRNTNTNVQGSMNDSSTSSYCDFNENEVYEEKGNNFEILSQVQSAMDDYYKKMKKIKDKRNNWKTNQRDPNSVDNITDRFYTNDVNSNRPNYEFDVQNFAKSELYSMNKTNIIRKLDEYSDILENNNLISNDFDNEFKRSVPNLNNKKKTTFTNYIDDSTIDKSSKSTDIGDQRFWQDQDIMNNGKTTRNSAIKNSQPFENQFQYLDCNYNRVMDPRLIGTSSRLDNRSTFNN